MDTLVADKARDAPSLESSPPVLRDYQQTDVERIRNAFRECNRVLYVLPTGGGKTVIFSYILFHAVAKGKRALVLAHRIEIVDQICKALTAMGVVHGRIQPDYQTTDDRVQVGMVQTVARRLANIPPPDLIVVDEAHHAVAVTWLRVFEAFPDARILGVSATPERLDGVGLADVFHVLVEGLSVRDLIKQGYLARFRYLAPRTGIDLSGVRTVAGDYNVAELERAVDRPGVTGDVIQNYLENLDGKTAVAFCVTVAHAEHVAQQFLGAGIPAASIDGTMSQEERRNLVDRLRSGALKVLTSCMIISEGFDAPAVNGAILLRPTQSFALHRQTVGRALRPKPDGSLAIILDHVGNVLRHGLPDAPHSWSLDSTRRAVAERKELAEFRTCPACSVVFARGTPQEEVCPDALIESCVFAPKIPVERPGDLEIVTSPPSLPPAVSPAWAQGIDIRHARGREWFDLIRRADGDRSRLQEIAVARGYRPGWVYHVAKSGAAKVSTPW